MSDKVQRWTGPMFAIPRSSPRDDVIKHGAWALLATHGAAIDIAVRSGIFSDPVMVLVTIELPQKPSDQPADTDAQPKREKGKAQ